MSEWNNWSGLESARPERTLEPADTAAIVTEIERARAAKSTVKMVGTGHSFTAISAPEATMLTPGGRTLVATMRANGAYTCLVSGGLTLFTSRIGAMIGFDEDRSNTLIIGADDRLEGRVAEPILGREAKLETLNELRQRFGLSREETLTIGDGANDIPMIEAAGLGVAYHGKPVVAEAAAARIDHGDLTALLYAQGYLRAEFVTP